MPNVRTFFLVRSSSDCNVS